MLSSIRIRNFKCYRDSGVVPLAPLTVILGCNNVGKSALIQPLLALKQTISDPSWSVRFITSGPLVDLGGFHDIIHGRDGSQMAPIVFDFVRDPREDVGIPERLGKAVVGIHIEFSYSSNRDRVFIKSLSYNAQDGGKSFEFNERESGGATVKFPQALRDAVTCRFKTFIPSMVPGERFVGSNMLRGDVDATDQYLRGEFQSQVWTRIFNEIEHVAPIRSRVPWYGQVGQRFSSEPGMAGENLLRVLSKAGHDGGLTKGINAWLLKNRSSISRIRTKKIGQNNQVRSLVADDSGGHSGVNVAAMGEGVSQMLPILASVKGSLPGDTILIEQPEIHLHPAAQATLGDLFIDATKDASRQLIVETHSEHLLLRIRRRIAEGGVNGIAPDNVSILFVEHGEGETIVRRLEVDDRGHFNQWPKGFFDTAYQEALALAKARK